jgi:hypothetical protein
MYGINLERCNMAELNDFLAHSRSIGFAAGTHFNVEIVGGSKELSLLVDSCSMPGINIMTQEMRTFGEITEVPYGVTYPPITLSMLVDNNDSVREFFNLWVGEIYDKNSRTMGYYSDYSKTVRVSLMDKNGNDIRTVILYEAFPKSVSDMQLGNDTKDILRLEVSLVYRYWASDSANTISEDAIARALAADDRRANQIDRVFANSNANSSNNTNSLRDWGSPGNIGTEFDKFGSDMSSSIGRSIGSCTRAMSDASNNSIGLIGPNGQDQSSSLKSGLNNLTSDFVRFGSGLSDLGKSLTSFTAPVSAISQSIGSMSGTLGAIDGTLSALGLGSPFSKVRQNLNKTASDINGVARLKGLPSHLGTIGANVGAMGSTFKQVSKSLDTVSGAPDKLKSAINKLGFNMERQGTNIANGSNSLDSYADINGFI